jgi:HK97 gp10 family phage protein
MATKNSGTNITTTVFEIEIELDFKDIQIAIAKETVKRLKKLSPKKEGIYLRGFTYKYDEKNKIVVIYNNGKRAGLGHLLEFGTNGINPQSAQPHYRPVFAIMEKKYLNEMKKIQPKK